MLALNYHLAQPVEYGVVWNPVAAPQENLQDSRCFEDAEFGAVTE
jgi:hypothetical protein